MLTFTNKETEEFEFDKCFIDGDSMLYRIAYTTNSDSQAASTFDLALLAVMRDTGSRASTKCSVRKDIPVQNIRSVRIFQYKIFGR